MQSKMLRRGCAILAIAVICTLVPVSQAEAVVHEADITTPVNGAASWSFLDFVSQIWARLTGIETQSGAHIASDG